MLTSQEDTRRCEALTRTLRQLVCSQREPENGQPVAPHELALYLEWFALAREGAASVGMFLLYSSPDALQGLSYRELARNLEVLLPQVGTRAV